MAIPTQIADTHRGRLNYAFQGCPDKSSAEKYNRMVACDAAVSYIDSYVARRKRPWPEGQSSDCWAVALWSRSLGVNGLGLPYLFHPRLGSIRLATPDCGQKSLDRFYSSRRYGVENGRIFARGLDYFAGFDKRLSPSQLLALHLQTIRDGLTAIEDLAWPSPVASFRHLLGVLDHIKGALLCIYHAVEYRYRSCEDKQAETSGASSLDAEFARLEEFALRHCQNFYRALTAPQSVDFDLYRRPAVDELLMLLNDFGALQPTRKMLHSPKIDHPLIIGLQAFRHAHGHRAIDLLMALPSGGTQLACAMNVAYGCLGATPRLQVIHYGSRSGATILGHGTTDAYLAGQLAHIGVTRSRILVADDSVRTGRSLQAIADAASMLGAESVAAAVAEIDLHGMKQTVEAACDGGWCNIANLDHPDLQAVRRIQRTEDICVNGVVKVRRKDLQAAREFVAAHQSPVFSKQPSPRSAYRATRHLSARIGALLFKPDAVDSGVVEELIWLTAPSLAAIGIRLAGVSLFQLPHDAGQYLYARMLADKVNFLMTRYLTDGDCVAAVYIGDGSHHVTSTLLALRGRQLPDYTADELQRMPYGLRDSLRGVVPLPGSLASYRAVIRRLISNKQKLTRGFSSWDEYLLACKNLVHAPEDHMELAGLLSVIPHEELSAIFSGAPLCESDRRSLRRLLDVELRCRHWPDEILR